MTSTDTGRILLDLGTPGTVFALLLAGHVVADFVLQPDRLVEAKRRPRGLLLHAAIVLAAHAAFLAPFLDVRAAVVLAVLAGLHAALDVAKLRLGSERLAAFAADQVLHLGLLGAAWWLALAALPGNALLGLLQDAGIESGGLTVAAVLITAFAFCVHGGAAVVRMLLGWLPRGDPPLGSRGRGKLIGMLERSLVLVLVLVDQWTALAFVLAAKSIARFKRLDEEDFAEYYLVGTLASVLVAVAMGLWARWMV